MSSCVHHHRNHQHGQFSATEIQEANKAYFAKGSHVHYHHNQSRFARLSSYVTAAIISSGLPLDEDTTRVLDYACGWGSVSKALAPHVKQIIGMDLSPDVVEIFNTAVSNQGIDASEMRAVAGDLCNPDDEAKLSDSEYQEFDVVVCSLALHHFPDPPLALKKMAQRLKKGGSMVIVDFRSYGDVEKEIPGREKMRMVVAHNGFAQEDMKTWYTEAGLEEVKFTEIGPKGRKGKGVSLGISDPETGVVKKFSREVFLVQGKRA